MSFDDILKGNIPKKYKDLTKNIIKGLIVLLIFHYSYYLQYIPIKLFHIDTSSYNETLSVIISCFGNFLLMFILYYIYRKDLHKEWIKFKENFWDDLNIGFYAWFVGLIIMFVSNIIISFCAFIMASIFSCIYLHVISVNLSIFSLFENTRFPSFFLLIFSSSSSISAPKTSQIFFETYLSSITL